MNTPLGLQQRQAGGNKNRFISTTSVTDGKMFGFCPLEDASFTVLTDMNGNDCIKDFDTSMVFLAGVTYHLANPAQTITLSSGSLYSYEY